MNSINEKYEISAFTEKIIKFKAKLVSMRKKMKIAEKMNFFEQKINFGSNLKIHQKKAKNRDLGK